MRSRGRINLQSVVTAITLAAFIYPSLLFAENTDSTALEPNHDSGDSTEQSIAALDVVSSKASQDICLFPKANDEWIDKFRESTHRRLCLTANWIDSGFGDSEKFDDENFLGKVSFALSHDTIDGLDPKLRVRVRTDLPNVSSRLSAFIGRVEEDGYVSNTEDSNDSFNNATLRSNEDNEADWLVGVGYRNPNSAQKGFDYSLGAKLSSGINPYAKVAYRYNFHPSESDHWRTTQTIFWRRDEKFGVSTNVDYTHLFSDRDILEWGTSIKYTGEVKRYEWLTGATWHHSLSNDRGVSSRIYFKGENEDEAFVPEYGLTFLYVRPFLRPWLNIETGIDFRQERNTITGDYDSAIRIGVQFEMLLGDYYSRERH